MPALYLLLCFHSNPRSSCTLADTSASTLVCVQIAAESFGFLTSRGMAAWAVAGAAAYVYFVVPKQREEREIMVRNLVLRCEPVAPRYLA